MDVKVGNHQDASDEKRKRKRMKRLKTDIRQQVEFYFSDANLRKDRFIKQEIDKSEDGYVAISTVAAFNRMRKLTMDQALIAKALGESDVLEVSEDETHLRRIKPIEEPKYNIDDITVYVENLPHNVDHDMLQKAFSTCGTVAYISLPRYKTTGDPKRFAFIEFTTPKEAAKACKLLNNPPRDRPDADGHFPTTRKGRLILPEHAGVSKQPLGSRHSETHIKEKLSKRKREAGETEETVPDAERVKMPKKKKGVAKDDGDDKAVSASKRKRDASEGAEDNAGNRTQRDKKVKRKEASRDAESQVQNDKKDGHDQKNKDSRKRKHSGGDSEQEKSSHSEKNHEARSHKSERTNTGVKGERSDTGVKCERSGTGTKGEKSGTGTKGERSRKDKTKMGDGSETNKRKREDSNSSIDGSKVKRSSLGAGDKDASDSGRDAKRRRMESEMTEDDADKRRKRRSRSHRNKKEEGEVAPMMQLKVIPKKEWLVLREEYLALQKDGRKQIKQVLKEQQVKSKLQQERQPREQKAEQQVPDVKLKATEPEFLPGVVLKVSSDKPFASRKELREQLEGLCPVAYMDLNDGDTGGFIRLKSAEGAQAVLGNASKLSNDSGPIELSLLSGQDEQKYWEKLRADRTAKLSTTKRKKKKRGIDRILDKSEKVLGASKAKRSHIFLGDDH